MKYKKIMEYCSNCNEEVEISSQLKIQKCPNCGAEIKPCSICEINCENDCPCK